MKELVERNAAYKKSLEYCEETCKGIDSLFSYFSLALSAENFTYEQQKYLDELLEQMCNDVKDQGTRKLRKAFVDYILENTEI